jgi:hypothetical protein
MQVHAFQTVQILDSAETKTHDLQNSPPNKSGVIVVSQSGETKDVHRVVVTAQSLGLTVMSVVNAVGSLIARTTKLGVYLNAGRENAVASTKAFTTQVTVLALVAIWFREAKDRLALTENRNGNGKPFHTSDVKEVSCGPARGGASPLSCRLLQTASPLSTKASKFYSAPPVLSSEILSPACRLASAWPSSLASSARLSPND